MTTAASELGAPPVVDGTTGRIKTTVDGEDAIVDTTPPAPEPKQMKLIDVPLENLFHDYNVLDTERLGYKAEVKALKKKIKALDERIDPILEELKRRDDEAWVQEDLLTDGGGEDEPDAGDE